MHPKLCLYVANMSGDEDESPINQYTAAASASKSSLSNESSRWTLRQEAGRILANISDTINENLIIARYGTFISISALTVWGISISPLFFRFKRISDIPVSYFQHRRILPCRVVQIASTTSNTLAQSELEAPVIVLVRHLSPVIRFLPVSMYQSIYPPSRDESVGDTLAIELAGIQAPTREFLQNKVYPTFHDEPMQYLQALVKDQSIVYVTCMARRGCNNPLDKYPLSADRNHYIMNGQEQQPTNSAWKSLSSSPSSYPKTHSIAAPKSQGIPSLIPSGNLPLTVVGRIRKPTLSFLPWLGQDVGSLLVQSGQAHVLSSSSSSGLLHMDHPLYPILYKSTKNKHVLMDAQYIQKIVDYEHKAIQGSHGLWSIDAVRKLNPDVIQEMDFQSKATRVQKIWRRIKDRLYGIH